ncbi:MAG TPA: response regulator [Verrucomicrobiae bacterium]|jgi:CheY-like chemotaxis protein|nr:response regulator [Verrucomicrobiae bacterium]
MNRKKILVVDDNLVITKTLSMKLESAGYQVIAATDGSEAATAARKEKPDLILLDISFPEPGVGGGVQWDGFKIIDWFRRLEEAKNVPVIVITAGEPEKYKSQSLSKGAIAFFQKPIDTKELIDVIGKTLNSGSKVASV